MTHLELEIDSKMNKSIKELMDYYNVDNRAKLISKALAVLMTACQIEKSNGELFARKGEQETKIVVR